MEEEQLDEALDNSRRLTLRSALTPLSETDLLHLTNIEDGTPETNKTPIISADEYIIQHRGRRRKPITWSPLDFKTDFLGPERKIYNKVPRRSEISSKLKRRLVLDNNEASVFSTSIALGESIAMKLKAISTWRGKSQ